MTNWRGEMKFPLALLAGAAVFTGAAYGEEFTVACAKGGDERMIEVLTPGEVGKTCDVRYTREGGANISIPYHADNTASFCEKQARALVTNLEGAGYACTPAAGGQLAAAPATAPEPSPAPAALAVNNEALPPAQTPEIAETVVADAPQAEIAINTAPEPAPVTARQPVIAPAPVPEAEGSLEEKMTEILSAPQGAPQVVSEAETVSAVRGPSQLTMPVVDEPTHTPRPAPVGRLVGAVPEVQPVEIAAAPEAAPEPRRAVAVTPAALSTTPEPAPASAPVVAAAPKPLKKPDVKPVDKPVLSKTAGQRKPEEVIEATLAAQTAAWNEGNLDAFMAIYWKNDDLKFVSGGSVTKGWSATMKRYRERYSDDRGLGQLGLEKLDVKMVTDDVAVVTGRFNHSKENESSSGAFSLVMKQANGVWRIVHDHSVVASNSAE